MKILPKQEMYLREMIRESLALNPLISIRRLQEMVEHNTHRPISDKYLAKLLQKVRREMVVMSDNSRLTKRFIEVDERYTALRKQLYRIAYWTPTHLPTYGIQRPKNSERINAIRTIAQMDLALLKTELDVGLFEDKRAALEEMLRQGLLPQELHEQIVGVFRTWKLAPSPIMGVLKES